MVPSEDGLDQPPHPLATTLPLHPLQGRAERYQGGFKDDQRHGRGTCLYPDGGRYTGEWSMGAMDGEGRFEYGNGDVFVGIFSKKRRVRGKLTWVASGDECTRALREKPSPPWTRACTPLTRVLEPACVVWHRRRRVWRAERCASRRGHAPLREGGCCACRPVGEWRAQGRGRTARAAERRSLPRLLRGREAARPRRGGATRRHGRR